MLISNVYKSIIVMKSLDTQFSRNVFEAVQKTRSTCFIGSKTRMLNITVKLGSVHTPPPVLSYISSIGTAVGMCGLERMVFELFWSKNRV